jgi:23S rRNA (uridine2552-2'-O)-methyltransferase
MGKFIVKDSFYNKAKKEGFRARSVYKLQEIQDKYHLIKRGDKVLDLGCSPGSFLQIISGIVGEKGWVLGIDILPTPKLTSTNVETLQADIREIDLNKILSERAMGAFDAVTCDIAPNLSGIRDVDNANIEELANMVIEIVEKALKEGGPFILKSFFGETLKSMTQKLQKMFKSVNLYKPAASRSVSSEVYLVCTGKR